MRKTQFFKILLKQHSTGFKYPLKVLLNTIGLAISLIGQIFVYQTGNSDRSPSYLESIFPFMPILNSIFSGLFFCLLIAGFAVHSQKKEGKNGSFWKNSINKITLIISFLSQCLYIPSVSSTLNICRNSDSRFSPETVSIAVSLTLLMLLSQLIITILQNLHVYSIKVKSFGKNSLKNPLLMCWTLNLLFPFVYQIKWLLFCLTIILVAVSSCLIFRTPRICHRFDKWVKIYLSLFFSVQIFILIQLLAGNPIFDINLIFFAIVLSLAIYFLLERRHVSFIRDFQDPRNQKSAMKEFYFNIVNQNHERLALILLSHQISCNDFSSCKCRSVLFDPQLNPTFSQREIFSMENQIDCNALNFVLYFYEKCFNCDLTNDTAQKRIQFNQKSSQLLFFCCILAIQKKMYTRAFLLLKQYQKQWKNLGLSFQVQAQLLIQEIIELKGIQLSKNNQKSALYSDYWTFHESYEKFVHYIEETLPLVEQIWIEMLSIEPNQDKLLNEMKRFDFLDRKIVSTYQNFILNFTQNIREINKTMSKYEKVVLNIFSDKLSIVKKSNLLLQKKIHKLQSENHVLDKEGRIFAKSFDNIVFLVDIDKFGQGKGSQAIRHKNKNFKQELEKKNPINNLNELLFPQIIEEHDKAFHKFLVNQEPILNHKNTVILFEDKKGNKQILEYEIWCQVIALSTEINVSVIMNCQNVDESTGVVLKNQKDEILYQSRCLKQVFTHTQLDVDKSPEDNIFFKHFKPIQKYDIRDIDEYGQKIAEMNAGNLTLYRVKLPFYGAESVEIDDVTYGENFSKSQQSKNTFFPEIFIQQDSDSKSKGGKSPIVDQILSNIEDHPRFDEKLMNLEKFYNQIHAIQSDQIFKKVTAYMLVVSCLFFGLWIGCFVALAEKSATITYLSDKVNSMSEFINSLCEADTALKLLVIKSYFNGTLNEFQKGIEILQSYQNVILGNIDQIVSDNLSIQIYHLNSDGTSFQTTQNAVNSVMSGFMKQVTYIISQPFQSSNFVPILSQNPTPFTSIIRDFFEANFNIVNRIFVTLFLRRSTFFQQKIVKTLQNFNQNKIFPFAITGFSIIFIVCVVLICYSKKQQQMKNESLKILEVISLEHKSHRLEKIKEFRRQYLPYQQQKVFSNLAMTCRTIISKANAKQDIQEGNSYNLFQEIMTVNKSVKSTPKVDLENEIPFFNKIAQIGRSEVFKGTKWKKAILKKFCFFLPFMIYFAHLAVQNVMFNAEIESKLNLQNQLAWQREFIAGSRQYSIELGMYENQFDLGKSNVERVDEIYLKLHDIKKEYAKIDSNSQFSKARTEFQNGNICENLAKFGPSMTVGVKLTKEECKSSRLGMSLERGFNQALVYYLDNVRAFSEQNLNPYSFTVDRRIQILTSSRLETIIYLGEYLHQVHQIMYKAYQQDIQETLNKFDKVNQMVGALILVLWIVLVLVKWKLITEQKKQEMSIVKATFKLVSFSLLSKSEPLIEKIKKGRIHAFFK